MKNALMERIARAQTIALLGHVRPDGDCVGSTLGLWNYLRDNDPEKRTFLFLEAPQKKFSYLRGFDRILSSPEIPVRPDLAVALDVSDHDRLGDFAPVFDGAAVTFNIDHHMTNPRFAAETVCEPESSSACEVLYELLDPGKIGRETAECLYTGIVTDTGVFKYSQTSRRTMEIAGILMEKGIDFGGIIDGAFYRKTWPQNQIMGRALTKAERRLGGKLIVSVLTLQDLADFCAEKKDIDGIAEQMRLTDGAECSCLASETEPGVYKLSLRSVSRVNVAEIALLFGGGGHIRAAGCTVKGRPEEFLEVITRETAGQLSC